MPTRPLSLSNAATLATAPEDEFTALARLAAVALGAPMGFVSLVLGEQSWTRALHGADLHLLGHDHPFATHVARTRATLAIDDICADSTWRDEVLSDPSLAARACVAAPILLCSGAAAGAICVLDRRQRQWTRGEIEQVQDFARIAAALLQDRMISSAMDAASDGIAMVDASERFFYMNQAHAAQFGYSCPTDLLGKAWTILYDDAEIARIRAEAFPQVWSAGAWTGSSIGRRRDGSHFAQEITLTRLPTGGIICATRDVSERKALEAETLRLTEMRVRAEAASAAKSAFLA